MKKLLRSLVLPIITAGYLAFPLAHDVEPPRLTPEKIHEIASAYRNPLAELLPEQRVPRTLLMSWISQPGSDAEDHHGPHGEPPHVHPAEHSPLRPAPPPEYSVTGTAARSYGFRLRLPGEA